MSRPEPMIIFVDPGKKHAGTIGYLISKNIEKLLPYFNIKIIKQTSQNRKIIREKGIITLPTAMTDEKFIKGEDKILKFFENILKPKKVNSPTEMLDNYMLKEAMKNKKVVGKGKIKFEDDEDEADPNKGVSQSEVNRRLSEYHSRRKVPTEGADGEYNPRIKGGAIRENPAANNRAVNRANNDGMHDPDPRDLYGGDSFLDNVDMEQYRIENN